MYAEFTVKEIGVRDSGRVRVRVGHGEDAQVATGTWDLVDGYLEMSKLDLLIQADEDGTDDQAILNFRNEYRGKWRLGLQVPYEFSTIRFGAEPDEIDYTLARKTDDGEWQNISCTKYLGDSDCKPRFHLSCSYVPNILGLAEQVDKGVKWIEEIWNDDEAAESPALHKVVGTVNVDLAAASNAAVYAVEGARAVMVEARSKFDLALEDVEALAMAADSLLRIGQVSEVEKKRVYENLNKNEPLQMSDEIPF